MKQIALTIVVALTTSVAFANELAVKFIKLNEGFRSTVYTCTAGKQTIGYGFTSNSIVAKGTITEAEANDILRGYVENCKAVVNRLVKVKLNRNQEAVLIDFVYHFGSGAFQNSTLLKKLNNGKYSEVPGELTRWVKCKQNGKVVILKGLVKRANRRVKLWNLK